MWKDTEKSFDYETLKTFSALLAEDIKNLYEEIESGIEINIFSIHTSVYPIPLQRLSVPLVCKVFNV